MNPIKVPDAAKTNRPDCTLVRMGPPRGVSDDDCGTVEMLISAGTDRIPGMDGRAQYAYYRPTDAELDQLRAGGFIEIAQYGHVVQPFSAVIWPGDSNADGATTPGDPAAYASTPGEFAARWNARTEEERARWLVDLIDLSAAADRLPGRLAAVWNEGYSAGWADVDNQTAGTSSETPNPHGRPA